MSRGLSYCSIDRPRLRSPLLQLLLDCCGKNGDSGETREESVGRAGGPATPMGTAISQWELPLPFDSQLASQMAEL